MKFLQSGLSVALLVVISLFAILFGSVLWLLPPVASGQAPPLEQGTVETSATDAVGIVVTATVGTTQGQCATTRSVQVLANTTVYYCFTVRHTGVSGDAALTLHNVRTSRGANRDLQSTQSFSLNPGEIKNTLAYVFTDTTSVDVTNVITWTAKPQDGQTQVVASSSAFIDVVDPQVSVTNYVGQDRNTCASARSVTVPAQTDVAFCISIQNSGDITFTSHTIVDQPLSINATINYTLPPGGLLNIIPTNMVGLGIATGSLERLDVNSAFSNNVSVTSRTSNGLSASGTSTATVDIGTTTVRMVKSVSTNAESCEGSSTIQVPPGTRVYYCVILENTGDVTLTEHRLTETYLSIDVRFTYPLEPGETLRITNNFLADNHLPIVFGPFELHPRFGNVINNTMNYSGSSPEEGVSVSAQAGTTGTFPNTPTITPTDRPDPTSTSTPGPTSTPTPTFTPAPVTPSPTPSFTPETPSPTPTRSYAISLLETPTPRSQVAGIPGDPQQGATPLPTSGPTVDPNFPATPQPQNGDPQSPVQDPFVATATQIAVDATVTAVAAAATASQLSVESAQATALAESQGPQPESPLESPLATPTVDPDISQSGDAGALPPVTVPATATETPSLPTPDVTLPGADVTVLPPVVTAVVGTETPAVVMLVVTSTPLPGEEGGQPPLPEGQRPIVYPTPTATPDFVMAAARTFDIAVTTFGWLWFLIGSLVFFITAGIVAGLFFRQSEVSRYDLPEPDFRLEEEADADRSQASPAAKRDDDEWPADLP